MQTPHLDALGVRDIRALLPTAPQFKIGTRALSGISSLTLHYSGPAVGGDITNDDHVLEVLKFEAKYHIDKNWNEDPKGKPIHGDGLMYTFSVLPSGLIVQCRPLEDYLYHCGSAVGNPCSIAIHLPMGDSQRPTEAQWNAFCALADALIADFGLHGRGAVKGHMEWKATACPGVVLWPRLKDWRAGSAPAPTVVTQVDAPHGEEISTPLDPQRYFRTLWDTNIVRKGPGRYYDEATRLQPGTIFVADVEKTGEVISESNVWFHNRDGSGFSHSTVLQAIDQAAPGETCFVGQPTISLDRWTQVLTDEQSPALIAGADKLYHIPISYGLNPAPALAFFGHESDYGKAGITWNYATKSWGNARAPQNAKYGSTIAVPNRGNFATYSSWENGLTDWCERMLYTYCGKWNLYTVQKATPKYAPKSDHNDPAVYAATVAQLVASWSK